MTGNVKGALLGLLGFAIFATNDVVVKVLGQTYSPIQTLFFLVLFGFPVALIMLMTDPTEASLRPRRPVWVALRVIGYLVNSLCAFYAFAHLPLAQVYSLIFTAPLMITLLAVPILGERLGVHRIGAIVAGFLGVLIVLRPGGGLELQLGHLAAFGSAFGGALAAVAGRKISHVERHAVILLYPMLTAFLLMGLALPAVYIPVPIEHMGLFAVVAALNFAATLTVIKAYRAGEAAVVAPMNYSQILWATGFGILLFGEYPDAGTLAGSAVVIASGLYILMRERGGSHSPNRPMLTTAPRLPLAPATRALGDRPPAPSDAD